MKQDTLTLAITNLVAALSESNAAMSADELIKRLSFRTLSGNYIDGGQITNFCSSGSPGIWHMFGDIR